MTDPNQWLPRPDRRVDTPAAAKGWLSKALAIVATALVFAASIAVSLVVFAVTITVLVVAGAYVWWKTRALRKRMQAQHAANDDVIEGVVIRKTSRHDPP